MAVHQDTEWGSTSHDMQNQLINSNGNILQCQNWKSSCPALKPQEFSSCHLYIILSSLGTPEVVITTISGATSYDKVGIVTALGFQCHLSPNLARLFPNSVPEVTQFSYSISQEICTRFCCALLCCGYAIVHNEFTWSIYPYSSGLLCWHWGNR